MVRICCGSFQKDAGTVTQTVDVRDRTGRSFRPGAIIFETEGYVGTSGFLGRDAIRCIGFDNFTDRRGMGARQGDGLSGLPSFPAAAQNSTFHANRSIVVPSLTNGALNGNDVVGYASNPQIGSFDVIWETSVSAMTGMRVRFIALDESVTAVIGQHQIAGGTGDTETISGLGITPRCVLFFAPPKASGGTGGIDNAFTANLGFANADGCQGTWAIMTYPDSAFPPLSFRYQRSDRCFSAALGGGISAGSGVTNAGHIGTLSSDQFTVINDEAALTLPLCYMALEGVDLSVFPISQPSGGVVTIGGLGKAPDAIWLHSVGAVSSSTCQAQARVSTAMSMGSAQNVGWVGCVSGVSATQAATYFETANALIAGVPDATGGTLETRIDTVTLQSDGLRLGWGLADSTVRQLLCCAFGTQTYVPSSPCSPTATQLPIYPQPPLSYQDPCLIRKPRYHAKIETELARFRYGYGALRNSAALGGYNEPRFLGLAGPYHQSSSDILSGAFNAQPVTALLADTDMALKTISKARGSLRNCDFEAYLTDLNWAKSDGPPRVLVAGKIYRDNWRENLVFEVEVNDPIGVNYAILSEELQIPQNVATVNHFPLCPEDNLGKGLAILAGYLEAVPTRTTNGVKGPGIVDGLYVGQVKINSSAGTPGPTDLAQVVSDLQTAVDNGNVVAIFGPRIGMADAQVLQDLGTVPSTYAELGAIIGYADLDDLLAFEAATGGSTFEMVVFAGHAISEWLSTNASSPPGGPSVWINGGTTNGVVDPAEIGGSFWIPQYPGDGTWASDITTDAFIDLEGANGEIKRLTVALFDPSSQYGIDVAAGAVVSAEMVGFETVGDGTGTPITNFFDIWLHLMVNFILQNYLTGAWLSMPQFLFSDGVTLVDRIDQQSVVDARDVSNLRVSSGYQGRFAYGSGGARTVVRDVIADANRSARMSLAINDFGQIFLKLFDRRRFEFLQTPLGLTHKLLTKQDMFDVTTEAKPDWQVTELSYQYFANYHEGKWDRNFGGGGSSSALLAPQTLLDRYGHIKKTIDLPWAGDDATALAVAQDFLSMLQELPRLIHYKRRGLCGLEDQVLQGVRIKHFIPDWTDDACLILDTAFDAKVGVREFVAMHVEDQFT